METTMEMHTPDSLRAIHGSDVRPRRRSRFLHRWLSRIGRQVRDARRRQHDDRMLMAMSDRKLRDIGLTNADISAARHNRHQALRRWRGE
jgi:uncharacterized protein YjiS (DUF1127 family)